MPASNHVSLFNRVRCFAILLLLGALLPTPTALAMNLPASSRQVIPFTANETSVEIAPFAQTTLTNVLGDPSFEAYTPNPYWSESDSFFGTPLCNGADCNYWLDAHPRTGTVWAWFGNVTRPTHTASLSQKVTFPSCGKARLQFYFWIGYAQAGSGVNDQFFAKVDGITVFSANASQINSYSTYTPINVNLDHLADGAKHTIQFSHINRDHDVGFNLDDVSLVGCPVIFGNAGAAGVTLNYTGGSTITDSSGNYSFIVPFGWSGTVTPSKGGYIFSPVKRTYSNVNEDKAAQNYAALHSISGNTGIAGTTLSYTDGSTKTVTSQPNGNYSFTVSSNWSGTVTPTHTCFTFDPVNRSYTDLAGHQTGQGYTPAFNPGSACADINIGIGGVHRGRFGLPVGASTRASFAGIDKGPVKIESTNAIPLIGAERLIYKVNGTPTSFSEMMALPDSQLDTTYWLPWYNNKDLNTQLRFANVSDTEATVHVYIGGTEMDGSPYTLAPGASTRRSYPGIDKGPVKIESDVPIVAAERVVYKVNGADTSFTEMMALPNSQLDTTYWLPWYNNKDLDTQLRIANVSDTDATVHVFIGGVEMEGSPYTIAPGASTRKNFPGIDKGPVKIESNVTIVAAERVVYSVNAVGTSFSEMMALPDKQLDTTYWLSWYNNKELDTQLRFANVSEAEATVHVYIGGVEMSGSPFTLAPGASTRKSFAGIDKGPVKIESNKNIVAAERVVYKVSGVNTSFTEMMALPNGLLDTIYWLPWYNNVELDTQLRFGVP